MTYELFLHGLADDLGVEADLLARGLLDSVSSQVAKITTDASAAFVDSSSNPSDIFTLGAWGGSGAYPNNTIQLTTNQIGSICFSNATGKPGFDVALHTSGDDDDGFVRITIAGILPDSQNYTLNATSGNTTINLPQQTWTSDVTVKFENPMGSAVNISVAGLVKPPKTSTLHHGREILKDAGIPIGKSQAILKGMVASMIEAYSDQKDKDASTAAALARQGDSTGLNRLLKNRKVNAQRAIAAVARQKLNNFAKLGGLLGHTGSSEDAPDFGNPKAKGWSGRSAMVRKLVGRKKFGY